MDTNNISALANLTTTTNIVQDVRTILQEARQLTARAINSTMVTAYWLIGKRIVVEEQQGQERAAYGEQILKKLSQELTAEFGNGFSYANLKTCVSSTKPTRIKKATHCVPNYHGATTG